MGSHKLLFTPGPLTTSPPVKHAMLRDVGSRAAEFLELVREIRERLVQLGGVSEEEYTAVLMQGNGTFGIEAVLSSTISPQGKLLVLVNGAYGKRIAQKVSNTDCFRIGHIGRLFLSDMQKLLVAVRETLDEMNVHLSPTAIQSTIMGS